MSRILDIHWEDRPMADALMDEVIVEIGNSAHACGIAFAERLEDGAAAGDAWAERVYRALACQGSYEFARERFGAQESALTYMRDGKVVSTTVPARVAVRQVNPKTGKRSRAVQLELFYTLPWAVLEAAIDALVDQRDTLSVRIAHWRQVMKLRDRYPSSITALHACELAGLDPMCLDLSQLSELDA